MNFRYVVSGMLLATVALAACGDSELSTTAESATGGPVGQPPIGTTCDWTQYMGNTSHTGLRCAPLRGLQVLAVHKQDPDAAAQNAAAGFLQVHEGGVVTFGDFYAFPTHRGADPNDRSGDVWGVEIFRWVDGKPAHVGSVPSSWRAVDAAVASFGYVTNGYVQAMPLAIDAGKLIVPQESGKITRVDLTTGSVLSTVDPFGGTPFSGDARVTTAGGFTVTADGTLYYTAVAWPTGDVFLGEDFRGAWLVRVRSTGSTLVPWTQIAASSVGVPQRNDNCNWPFGTAGTPQPHSPDAVPPVFHCGMQRPEMNASIAIRPTDGHLVIATGGNNNIWERDLLDVDPVSLQPVRAYRMRERLLQGCGVRVPLTGSNDFGDTCDQITAHGTVHAGFAPDFNLPGSFRGDGIMDGYPFCLPNGDCGMSGYDFGFFGDGEFDARGAIELFHTDGSLSATNLDYGWEVTPALDGLGHLRQDHVILSALDSQAAVFSQSFDLLALSQIPIDDTANAVDMLSDQEIVDTDDNAYALDGNGHVYQIDAAGNVVDFVALPDPDTGAPVLSMDGLSSLLSFDGHGHLYVPYAGNVYVIGGTGVRRSPLSRSTVAALRRASPHALQAQAAKAAALVSQPIPTIPTIPNGKSDLVLAALAPESLAISSPQSTATSNEIECDPVFGCSGGGGGDSCSALCYVSADCVCGICLGADINKKRAGLCTR